MYVVAIRGTDGAQEWADDLDFRMIVHPSGNGRLVDEGFYSIYETMKFHPLTGGDFPIVDGIKALVLGSQIIVLGHSLGAALGTYLTLNLKGAACNVKACLFASPKTGNETFVDYFDNTVHNYDVFNYEKDIVPKIPQMDILHLSLYKTLPQAKTITDKQAQACLQEDIACFHHLICYVAMLDAATYRNAIPNFAQDDQNCARCVVSAAP